MLKSCHFCKNIQILRFSSGRRNWSPTTPPQYQDSKLASGHYLGAVSALRKCLPPRTGSSCLNSAIFTKLEPPPPPPSSSPHPPLSSIAPAAPPCQVVLPSSFQQPVTKKAPCATNCMGGGTSQTLANLLPTSDTGSSPPSGHPSRSSCSSGTAP